MPWLLSWLALGAGMVAAQAAHTQTRLVLEAGTVRPGQTVLAAVRLHMDSEWHIYWRNPGDTGLATDIQWTLPAGITAGEIQWPTPDKDTTDGLTTYVYNDEAVLLVPLTVAEDLKPGPVKIQAKLSWLECKVECVPADAVLQATLNIGEATQPSADAPSFAAWKKRIPISGNPVAATAWWDGAGTGNARPVIVQWNTDAEAGGVDFFPYPNDDFEVEAGVEKVPAAAGKIQIRKRINKSGEEWPKQIAGLLIQGTGAGQMAYEVTLSVGSTPPAASAVPEADSAGTVPLAPPSLWKMLLYAFTGGMILNIMPCVLPVIALKILGFVGQAEANPRRVRGLGLVYALGVIVSFLLLAGLVIGVKAAGHSAGWGMQFGNPQFLVVLTALVTLVALNLFGVFEINLSGQVMGAADSLASKHGASGAFFNGVLATILATPCTAPFLGAALGFAFTQSAPIILLMFSVVALGLAAPYVVLSWHPSWLRFLPKPGLWMERFKVAMGFPMLMTAAWLFSLVPSHYGRRSWWLVLFLIVVAMAAWAYGIFVQRGRSRRGIALAGIVALLAGGYVLVLEGQLHWRTAEGDDLETRSTKAVAGAIDWKPWSADAVAEARAAGRPVLVDFTADWCLTCQLNKKVAIEIPQVETRLKQLGAVALLGDYTKLPASITAELNRFNRAGVPLVLVFPADATRPPVVLPEALTPGIVLNALEQIAR